MNMKLLVLGSALVCLFLGTPVLAAGPRVIVSWKADTYVPAHFPGKALPIADSQITLGVDLLDGGKFVDLSKQAVYWRVNGKLVASGQGTRRAFFSTPNVPGDSVVKIQVELPDYAGGILKTISIPVVYPEAVIEIPFPGAEIKNLPADIVAWPYFFNIKDPSEAQFLWKINTRTIAGRSEDPDAASGLLHIDANTGLSRGIFGVSVDIVNPTHLFERATKNASFNLTSGL